MKKLSLIAPGLAMVLIMNAQTGNRKATQNAKSPSADTSMTVAGKKITIEYNAPSARGRKVEGGLIPFDRPWRLGADSATTLTTEADIMLGDVHVPKGIHTLYLAGAESGWQLIVNKQTGQWGTQYDKAQDLGRTAMKLTKLSEPAEQLKINLKPAGSGGTLEIAWGNTRGSVPIMVH